MLKLTCEHKDANGRVANLVYTLNLLEFAKHLAFAGMGINKSVYNLYRFLGFLFEFTSYWHGNPTSLSIPQIVNNDPTELGQISNRIGKAFADFLAKRLYNAIYTHNYEDVMRLHGCPIKGKRPDLYCVTSTQQFAIEAKGLKCPTVSTNAMIGHKKQSKTGPVQVHFTVASVSYDLYGQIQVKFYDPEGSNVEYSEQINQRLRDAYYESILNMIKESGCQVYQEIDFDIKDIVAYSFPIIKEMNFPHLLLHKSIVERNWQGIQYEMTKSLDGKVYVDVDGVGFGAVD